MDIKLKLNDPKLAREFFEKKLMFTLGPAELKYAVDEKQSLNVIDVRAAEAFTEGHVPGAKSLPEEDWKSLKGLSKDKINVIYCYSALCHLAARAGVFFASQGFPVMELEGGIEGWKEYYENDIEKGAAEKAA